MKHFLGQARLLYAHLLPRHKQELQLNLYFHRIISEGIVFYDLTRVTKLPPNN